MYTNKNKLISITINHKNKISFTIMLFYLINFIAVFLSENLFITEIAAINKLILNTILFYYIYNFLLYRKVEFFIAISTYLVLFSIYFLTLDSSMFIIKSTENNLKYDSIIGTNCMFIIEYMTMVNILHVIKHILNINLKYIKLISIAIYFIIYIVAILISKIT